MDWRFNTIWFEQLNQDKFHKQDYKENKITGDSFAVSEYAILWHLKHKNLPFDNLPINDKLLYLELNWANIKNFQGIKKFKSLKRLELHYCTKLENDSGLKEVKNQLEFLHINQSKKFKFSDELLQLKNLRVLCLNACGPIDNLNFLSKFPNLIDFRFVDTNIVNGDLTPILEHPTIRSVGFLNKRHYNYNDEKLKDELKSKSTKEFKHFVDKGQFQTFRYDFE